MREPAHQASVRDIAELVIGPATSGRTRWLIRATRYGSAAIRLEYCLPRRPVSFVERTAVARGLTAGAIMRRRLVVLAMAVFAGAFCGACASAETALTESPITPGFWSFPRKATAASDMVAACRAHLEIHFADGHFIGLRAQKRDLGLIQREVESVGRCTFDRDKQVDICEIRNIHSDGSILAGVLTVKYTLDLKGDAKAASKANAKAEPKGEDKPEAKKIAKILVTPKMVTDSPVDNAPYEAFAVRCPDDTAWTILSETAPSK
jgi:hypothetical protein